jgi:hypothetical protein
MSKCADIEFINYVTSGGWCERGPNHAHWLVILDFMGSPVGNRMSYYDINSNNSEDWLIPRNWDWA